MLTPIIARQFGNYLRELEGILADGRTPLCVGRIGNQGLTILGITANYFAQPHIDNKYMGFAFLSWFVKGEGLLIFFHSYIMYFSMCSCFIYVFCLFFCRTWRSWTYQDGRGVFVTRIWCFYFAPEWDDHGFLYKHSAPLYKCRTRLW